MNDSKSKQITIGAYQRARKFFNLYLWQLVHDLYTIAHSFYDQFHCNEFENSYGTTAGNFGIFAFELHKQSGAGRLSNYNVAFWVHITKTDP